MVFFCILPCDSYFKTKRGLAIHRSRAPRCLQRWNDRIASQNSAQTVNVTNPADDEASLGGEQIEEDNNADGFNHHIDHKNLEDFAEYRHPDEELADDAEDDTKDDTAENTEDNMGDDAGDDDTMSIDTLMQELPKAPEVAPQDAQNPIEDNPRHIVNDMSDDIVKDFYPGAASVLGIRTPKFAKTYNERLEKGQNVHYPFAGPMEWEVAQWLHQAGVSRARIDKFVKLDYVSQRPLSFLSGEALMDRIEQLPSPGAKWSALKVSPESGTPLDDVFLYYRNPLEAIETLLALPSLKESMEFVPQRVWETPACEERLYTELFTGDWAWETQDSLPKGATLIPIILASDKTHLTVLTGDKKAWPIYMTLGNIKSTVRNKPSNGAWVLIGYLPITKFKETGSGINTMLSDRLFHQCVKTILDPLREAGVNGKKMVDSVGHQRLCFPRVAVYIADNPEQVLINVASSGSSPISTAGKNDLGSSRPFPPRSCEWILSKIRQAGRTADPHDFVKYKAASKELGLNGVHKPFWEDLPGYDSSLCLCPDLLHGGHRFWRDHVLQWVINLIGFHELDRRLKLVQPVVGTRHFKKGISHLTQWTCREDRELQRIFLALLYGTPDIDHKSMKSLRALQDFLYLAQYRSHSTTTLEYLKDTLRTFHSTKDVFIRNGARRGKKDVIPHFNIPKLAGLHVYLHHIPRMGSSPQYSSEISETLHKTMAKAAYKVTNRKDFFKQMCRYLDRCEKISRMNEYVAWANREKRQREIEAELRGTSAAYREAAMRHVNAAFDQELEITVKRKGSAGRIWHTLTPHFKGLTVEAACGKHQLSAAEFVSRVLAFVHPPLLRGRAMPRIDLWNSIRITLPTVQEVDTATQTRRVQALPPSSELPYGRYHCVLVHETDDARIVGIKGYRVAQVRMFFRMALGANHPLDMVPLAYVHWFSKPLTCPEKPVEMYLVKRLTRSNGLPLTDVIEMDSIYRFVQLIPKFPRHTGPLDKKSPDSVMEQSNTFLINSFTDMEVYQTVY